MIREFDNDAIISEGRRISYREMLQRVTLFGAQFPKETDEEQAAKPALERPKVLILCENREGFIYAFFSVWLNRCIAVPIDAQSGAADIAYVLGDCRPSFIWTTGDKLPVVSAAMKEAAQDIPVLTVDDFEHMDVPSGTEVADIQYNPESTAVIVYTSGTTGGPKGVMLSFKNILTDTYSILFEAKFYQHDRRSLILLPLHHILPLQAAFISPMVSGVGVAISPSMAAQDIMKTLHDARVGLMIGVPRLWQSLYEGMMGKINASPFTRCLYKLCKAVNRVEFSRLVFRKIHQMMGGHLEVCVSGGAPLDPDLWQGLHVLGLDIHEGYGLTETSPVIAACPPGRAVPGCVGPPFKSCDVSFDDGEICVKGDIVMQGYYNKPEETAAVFDGDGRFHTGDLGFLDERGLLHVTGRKKEIIVLPNGKNISPVELESLLASDTERVMEVAVVEDDDVLKAIIRPRPQWAGGRSLDELESALKREVIDVFNEKVATYKQIFDVIVYEGELPKTKIGKIQRFLLGPIVESWRISHCEASVSSADNVPQTEEYRIIVEYIAKEKKRSVGPHQHLITDLRMDSLDMVGLECFIEKTFGIQIVPDEFKAFASVEALTQYVAQNKTRILVEKTNWKELLSEGLEDFKVPPMGPLGWIVDCLLKITLRPYLKPTIEGLDRVPSDGPFILVSNHQSYLDTFLIVEEFTKKQFKNLRYLTKEEHTPNAFVRFMARRHGVIVLSKHDVKESIMQMGETLRQGRSLLVFPEGTRTDDGKMNEFRPTFAILSKALDVPVLPVRIDGSFDALPKHHKIIRKRPVRITFLPFAYPKDFKDEYEMTEKIQKLIDIFALR